MSVHQRVTGRPLLGHIDQSAVDGAVAVGVVFTHGIADDTGAFTVGLIRTVVQLDHGEQDASLNRLKAVSYIGQRPGADYTHGVVDVRLLHGLFKVYLVNLVKYIWFHIQSPLYLQCNS